MKQLEFDFGQEEDLRRVKLEDLRSFLASEKQVGGSHYKDMPIQPGEYIRKNKIGWYEGNAIKYISRYAAKNGRQDIEKAIHYLELILEELDKNE